MTTPETIPDLLDAMKAAFLAGDQARYAELTKRLLELHTEAAKRIRAKSQWKVPHP